MRRPLSLLSSLFTYDAIHVFKSRDDLRFTRREIEVECHVFEMERFDRTRTNAEQL